MPETASPASGRLSRSLALIITEGLAPTLLVGVFLLAQPLLTPGVTWLQSITAAVFTVGLPFALLLWLKHRGAVTDHHISVREDRAPVMAFAALSLGIGVLLLMFLQAPAELFGAMGAIFIGLVLCLLANLVWKLSVHSAVAAYIALALLAPVPALGPALALLLASAVGWSRVRLKAHTPEQVLAGHAVGCLVFAVSLLLP
ncbi:phosphatase PAP2 family protein [Arthrobacter echini]|uniref:Phosphatase PAP2 family protein n=1 Tax=Arthrobacter echini TaxID=1529066 RepID=A0A4S5E2V8_9MICC|nr:phosphatase PAP2 family protein [Arthrobacter echini]THJ65761.1 phosphatase PAP2 family protein [Arthrobacter echini]